MQTNQKWENLEPKINNILIKTLREEFKFEYMMPVQLASIPHFISNRDVAVEAATGSGKTLAYLIPTLHILLKMVKKPEKKKIYSLILSPTRELGQQIFEIAKILVKNTNYSCGIFIGGTSTQQDLQSILENGSNIMIGTVGKIKEICQNDDIHLQLKTLEVLILDEADRLMDTEYEHDISYILDKLPKQRRTSLYSATLSQAQMKNIQKYGMRNPVQIQLKKQGQENGQYFVPETLENQYIQLNNRFEKIIELINFLFDNKNEKLIVFLNTCASVEFYGKLFKNLPVLNSIHVELIHGQMKQKRRNKIFKSFTDLEKGVLVCTDVVARGILKYMKSEIKQLFQMILQKNVQNFIKFLQKTVFLLYKFTNENENIQQTFIIYLHLKGIDFMDVKYILQLDPPTDPSFFIHRIGRTARTGKSGTAILFLQEQENTFINYLQIKNVDIIQKNQCPQTFTESDIIKQVETLFKSDRDLIEKGKNAFVSFVRSYKEHDLKYIFEFNKLSLGDIANSFFTLTIPRVKEILGKKIDGFKPLVIQNAKEIEFKDKNQGQQFQQKKENLLEKRKKIEEKKEKIQLKNLQNLKNNKSERKKIKQEIDQKDQDNNQTELRLVKKLKAGKISLAEYNKEMAEIDGEYFEEETNVNYLLGGTGHKKKK